MATLNPFDLLEDVESDDPSLLIAVTEKKIAAKKAAAPAPGSAPTSAAKLPTKPLPPAQAGKIRLNDCLNGLVMVMQAIFELDVNIVLIQCLPSRVLYVTRFGPIVLTISQLNQFYSISVAVSY
jgi:Stm1